MARNFAEADFILWVPRKIIGGRNPDGTFIEDSYSAKVIRNVQPQDGVFSEYALEGLENC